MRFKREYASWVERRSNKIGKTLLKIEFRQTITSFLRIRGSSFLFFNGLPLEGGAWAVTRLYGTLLFLTAGCDVDIVRAFGKGWYSISFRRCEGLC